MEFSPKELFSSNTQKVIAGVSNDTPQTIDDIIRVQEATDKSHKLHSLLSSWAIQQSQERSLRKLYAICFMVFLGLQLVTLNVAFFLVSIKIITITEVQFHVFFVSMFGEITALVLIITKYLFPIAKETKMLDMLKDL